MSWWQSSTSICRTSKKEIPLPRDRSCRAAALYLGRFLCGPLFSLGPRLALCAALVREGSPLCDVGTDHAYLPIWLLKTGKIPRALACDIKPRPPGGRPPGRRQVRGGGGALLPPVRRSAGCLAPGGRGRGAGGHGRRAHPAHCGGDPLAAGWGQAAGAPAHELRGGAAPGPGGAGLPGAPGAGRGGRRQGLLGLFPPPTKGPPWRTAPSTPTWASSSPAPPMWRTTPARCSGA